MGGQELIEIRKWLVFFRIYYDTCREFFGATRFTLYIFFLLTRQKEIDPYNIEVLSVEIPEVCGHPQQ